MVSSSLSGDYIGVYPKDRPVDAKCRKMTKHFYHSISGVVVRVLAQNVKGMDLNPT